jgi:hypothetical protein
VILFALDRNASTAPGAANGLRTHQIDAADALSIRPSTIPNVSGTAVSDRDPPICEFFQKPKAI